jgi:N utilization substance protein B
VASRRKARILAVQALYAWDMTHTPLEDLLSFSWLDPEKLSQYETDVLAFSRLLIAGTIERIEEIDALIKQNLEHWTFDRLRKVDLAILRVGCYSILYQKDIPAGISIDEAIEIAKEYGSDESYRFVNGVLDAIKRSVEGGRHDPDKE